MRRVSLRRKREWLLEKAPRSQEFGGGSMKILRPAVPAFDRGVSPIRLGPIPRRAGHFFRGYARGVGMSVPRADIAQLAPLPDNRRGALIVVLVQSKDVSVQALH